MNILRWDDIPDHLRNDSSDRDRRKKWPYDPAARCEAARHRFSFPSGGEYYDRCVSPADEDGLCLYHWREEYMPTPTKSNQSEDEETMELEEQGDTFQEIALRMSVEFHLRIREQTPGPIPDNKCITETAQQFYAFLLNPRPEGEPT